jgi:hypothetical protein
MTTKDCFDKRGAACINTKKSASLGHAVWQERDGHGRSAGTKTSVTDSFYEYGILGVGWLLY